MAGRPKKLGPDDQARIIELRDRHGMTLSAIATQFSVGIATVSRICASGSGARDTPPQPGRSHGDALTGTTSDPVVTRANDTAPVDQAVRVETGNESRSRNKPEPGLNADVVTAPREPRESRPVLSLQNQGSVSSSVSGHEARLDAKAGSDRPQPTAANAGQNGSGTSGADSPAPGSAGVQCAAGEIRDSSRAVAQALEQWRQTRAQEDYARVDKALADIRRALAKAEVELWTWQ
ncbi:helix-turn-helix domain-containing protein [Fodinicurvata sp. EGI_FJ10296]|uniref:helix-turn-helix domain-containing protein n=1 Tax=Fodinicurvata sp. EGI_FJ10296 TaxID=3231908 RepID=UPI003454DE71